MSGQQAIIQKIISEAEAYATQVREQAHNEANSIREKAVAENQSRKEQIIESANNRAREIIQARLNACELEIKRKALSARHSAVESAFDKAKKQIISLKDTEYLAIIKLLLKKYAETGDVVVIGAVDKARITEDFIESIAKEMKIQLTLQKETENIDGGIILRNPNWDKNMTIDSDFKLLREKIEFDIAKLLLEENQ